MIDTRIVQVIVPVESSDDSKRLSMLWADCTVEPSMADTPEQRFAEKAVKGLIDHTMGNV